MENEVKQRILQEAFRLIYQSGIKNVTMDDLARHLGMSKKTFYVYYSSKDELIHEIIQVELSNKSPCLFYNDYEDVIAQMVALMEHGANMLASINPLVFSDLQKYYPRTWALVETHLSVDCDAQIKEQLTKGIQQGYFRPDIDVEILSTLRRIELLSSFDQKYFPAFKYSVSQVVYQHTEHFIYGLCTEKGYQKFKEYKQKNHYHEV